MVIWQKYILLEIFSNKMSSSSLSYLTPRIAQNDNRLRVIEINFEQIPLSDLQAFTQALEKNIYLKVLTLSHTNIGDQGARYLSQALCRNTSLKEISLIGNNIGDEGALFLAQSLLINQKLTSLDLTENLIGNEGAYGFFQALLVNMSLGSLRLNPDRLDQKLEDTISFLLTNNRSSYRFTLIYNEKMARKNIYRNIVL